MAGKTGRILKAGAAILTAALLITSILFLTGNTDKLNISPFDASLTWEAPSYVVQDGGRLFVVDASKTRISVLEDGEISHVLTGSGSADSFSGTDYIATDGTYLYVADVVYASSGTRVSEEHIRKFSLDGVCQGTLFSVSYEDGKETMPAQNGCVCWMGSYRDAVYFLYYDKGTGGLSIRRLTEDGQELIRSFAGEMPEFWNVAYDAATDRLYMVGKDSRVYAESDDRSCFERMKSVPYNEFSIYSDIDCWGGRIYATDLGSRRVMELTTGTLLVGSDDPTQNPLYYRLSACENGAATTDNESILTVDFSGGNTFSESGAPFREDYRRAVILAWAGAVVIVLCAVAFLGAILVSTLRNTRSRYTGTSLLVAAAVLISVTVISYTVLSDTFPRLSSASHTALLRTADVISAASSGNGIGDAVKEINSIDDYGSDAHLFLQAYMDSYCDAAYNNGSNMYYVIYKFDVENDLVYGIADYEKTAGAIYPYCPYEGSDYQYVAESGEVVSVASSMDAYGAWSFAITPIYGSDGEITAVAEFGINMMTEQAQNYELISSIIVRVVVIIVMFLLLLIEGTALADGVAGFRTEGNPDIPYFLRPMMFLTFFASNLSAAFIPQMSLVLYESSGQLGLDVNLASALPMSAQLFAIAVGAMLAGRLFERLSMKTLMLISCGVQVCGYLTIAAAAAAEQYLLFCAGHLLSGLGIGVIVVGLNSLPDRIADENLRNSYYTSLNAGVIAGVVIGCSAGSYVAEVFGHAATFLVSAVISVLIGGMIAFSVHGKRSTHAAEVEEKRVSTLRFLTAKDVLSFFLCVMVPLLVILYFKDYLFPMYAYESGVDDVTIGNILLFAGAASIVFGATISGWLFRWVKTTGTVIISSALSCCALLLFGLSPSFETAVAAVFVLSLTTGFGLAGQEVFYSSLPSFRSYGAQRSMSIYSLFDNVSQTAGPLLMGALLRFGFGGESLLLGGAGLALLVIFILIQLISTKKKAGAQQHDSLQNSSIGRT